MLLIRLILFYLFTTLIVNAQGNKFLLTGETSEMADGKYFYIRDLVNGGNIDSAQVKSNRFTFNTKLSEPVLYVMLFTKDRSKFKELWLSTSQLQNSKFVIQNS